ncbi:MAG: 30S ribosomal protein S12 methylthiotransferase RimO [Nitriliruptoraceae bacterium]
MSTSAADTIGAPAAPVRRAAPKVAIVTLGCGRNEVDSEQLAGLFHRDGSEVVADPADAEVVLVNTCTFIAPAKQESIDTILAACQLKQEGARAVLVVGCMAQRYPEELAEAIPEADAIVGFDGYPRLPGIVDDVLAGREMARVLGVAPAHPGSRPGAAGRRDLPLLMAPATAVQDELDRIPASGPRFPLRHLDPRAGPRSWAYLKIASGCDRVCTFCAIPSFRGRFRSRPLDELVAEAHWLAAQGIRELVLVSENTTSWGKDLPGGRRSQPGLLDALAEVEGIERLRLMYLQPAELTDELLVAITTHPKVASYLDLSLQHVSGPVVARMGRSGDEERFAAVIARARELDPDVVLRSNFILGFPGETEQDVARLERFLTEQRLDWAGFFAFSVEDGTPSATLPDQVPAAVALERLRHVASVQERVADAAARRFLGRRLEVLVDEATDEGGSVGRSFREAPDTDGEVALIAPDGRPAALPVGRIVTARVLDSVGVDLVAEVNPVAAGGEGG